MSVQTATSALAAEQCATSTCERAGEGVAVGLGDAVAEAVAVAVADLELLAGDLDAALAGDPSLHQDRALATANGLVARGGQAQRGSA
jgi:hypothetical protein